MRHLPVILCSFFAALLGLFVGIRFQPDSTFASNINNGGGGAASTVSLTLANASSTGTTLNKLAKFTGAPATVVITSAGDNNGIVGVVSAGAGTTGNATVITNGLATCIFENATTAGNWVINGTSVAGDCRDAGLASTNAGPPVSTAGAQVIGIVQSTNVGAGTYTVLMTTGGQLTTKFRAGLYLSGGTTGFTPCSNDSIQGFAAGVSIWLWQAVGVLIQPQGTACGTPVGPLEVAGGTVGNALTAQGLIRLVGPAPAQNGNNSSASGAAGGAITLTPGAGGGFTGGSSSTAGTGGQLNLNAGAGGPANSGSTNGVGGNVVITAGAAGGGAGTAASAGLINLASKTNVTAFLQGASAAPSVNATSCTGATIGTGATNTAGTITALPTGACSVVLTFASATAANGWTCAVSDQTTANLFRQTANTTTTVTFAGTSVSGDVLTYGPCVAF